MSFVLRKSKSKKGVSVWNFLLTRTYYGLCSYGCFADVFCNSILWFFWVVYPWTSTIILLMDSLMPLLAKRYVAPLKIQIILGIQSDQFPHYMHEKKLKIWSDLVDVKTDLNHCWGHSSFHWFYHALAHARIQRGTGDPDPPPWKSQKYRVS